MNCHFCVWKQRKAISERDRNSLQIHRGKKEYRKGGRKGKERREFGIVEKWWDVEEGD